MDNRVDHANPFTNQIFQEAVIRSDVAIVKLLLRNGIYPGRNERNRQGLTALQQCVLDGNGRMAILLLEAGADIEAKTSNGWTCLHIASAICDLDILSTLVNHCCDLVALTKNEELPIDLAGSRDIKIKLAKEMSRVGYSELAQWYMRKLAACEGGFFVLSTDTLLDLACDEKQDREYSDDYVHYAQQYNNYRGDVFIHSPRKERSSSLNKHAPENQGPTFNKDIWFGYAPQEQQMTYLTYSSGYISEVLFDPASGQYSNKVLTSTANEPSQKKIVDERVSLASISEVEGAPIEESKSRSGTLKRTSSSKRHSQNIGRKPSTIELHIDYMQGTESDTDDDDDAFEDENAHSKIEVTPAKQLKESSPSREPLERLIEVEEMSASNDTLVKTSSSNRPPPQLSNHTSAEFKERNVKFNAGDTNNEFCNCPTCKKLGYAFSPDIQTSSRKAFHVSKSMNSTTQQAHATDYNRYFYLDQNHKNSPIYFDERDYQLKTPKRKKNLFSGIKSIFKDTIKVRTNTDASSAACDDAGILFSVSLRDKNKAKAIRQRSNVRRSNSFSGPERNHPNEEVSVIPHSEVVAPPHRFADVHHYQDEEHLNTEENHFDGYSEIPPGNAIQYVDTQHAQMSGHKKQTGHSRNTYEQKSYRGGDPECNFNTTEEIYYDEASLPHGFHYTRPSHIMDDKYHRHHQQQQQQQHQQYSRTQIQHSESQNRRNVHPNSDLYVTEMISHEHEELLQRNDFDNCVFCTSQQAHQKISSDLME